MKIILAFLDFLIGFMSAIIVASVVFEIKNDFKFALICGGICLLGYYTAIILKKINGE